MEQTVDYAGMSVDELHQHLEQIEQNRADLERALKNRAEQQRHDVAQQVKDLIADSGCDIDDIFNLIGGRRKKGGQIKKNTQYKRYVDPDNAENVYVRGVIPGWMKRKMTDQGYDWTSKEDRDLFKERHLLEG